MLIYQERFQYYKEPETMTSKGSSAQHLNEITVKKVLSRKNLKFLASLGLTIKKSKRSYNRKNVK